MKPNLKSQSKGNKALSDVDALREYCEVHKSAVDYLVCLLKDIKENLPPELYKLSDLSQDIQTIESRFVTEGLAFATSALPKLSAGLFQYLETGHVNYPSFRIKKDTVHPAFLSGLFRLACCEGDHQVDAIKFIYQISVCFKKLKGPYLDSILVKQLNDFVAVDESFDDIDLFDDVRLPILQQARAEVYQLFKDFSVTNNIKVIPRPGPGATNTSVAKHMRYRPHVLYTQIDKVFPYVEWFMVNPYDLVNQTKLFRNVYLNPVAEQVARLKYVFKVFGKARGICMEENETQFFQQSLKRALYDYLETNPLTKGKINFKSQKVNQMLALSSSLDRRKATIDMHDASDRIWRHVVSWLFQDITELHDALMALSTKWISFPKELGERPAMKCNKFAPMGSGLCFPIMAIVHWALIRSIIELSMQDNSHKEEVYVYGDDIILPAECVEMVYTYLPYFGMKINESKSYYRSYFRESCGVHAYKGKDITPVYFKYLPVNDTLQCIMSCIAQENQLYCSGYLGTASHFRANIRKTYTGFQFPFVPQDSSVFGFKRPELREPVHQDLVRQRYDKYGNVEKRVRMVKVAVPKAPPPTEFECYLRHVCTQDIEHEVGGEPDSSNYKLVWKWVPTPELRPPLNVNKSIKDLLSIQNTKDNSGESSNEPKIEVEQTLAYDPTELHKLQKMCCQRRADYRRRATTGRYSVYTTIVPKFAIDIERCGSPLARIGHPSRVTRYY